MTFIPINSKFIRIEKIILLKTEIDYSYWDYQDFYVNLMLLIFKNCYQTVIISANILSNM